MGTLALTLRAYTYIRTMGPDGLRQVSENAVLHANYFDANDLSHIMNCHMHNIVNMNLFYLVETEETWRQNT